MLIPEIHQLFVCPFACGRHGAIGAMVHGYKDRLSYLFIDEGDIVSGGYEQLIIDGVDELLDSIKRPRALLIVVSCLDDLLGTDHEVFLKELRLRHPDVKFGLGHMNPISGEGKLPPAVNIQRSLYGFLEPSSRRLRQVNILGQNVPPERGDLHEFLEGMGYETRVIGECKTFDEYLELSSSVLDIVAHPVTRAAAREMKERLGIEWTFAPVSFDGAEIEAYYRAIAEILGEPFHFDLGPWKESLAESLEGTREAVGGREISVDDSATLRPFSLGKLLLENGFRVVRICADECPEFEKDSLSWLMEKTSVEWIQHGKHDAPLLRESRPEMLAIGFECAYLHGVNHVVSQLSDEGQYGFAGMILLLERMRRAVSRPVDLQTVIGDYGLVV
jgi:nitrogenase molybdenum-iron protein alpha/beta subunit